MDSSNSSKNFLCFFTNSSIFCLRDLSFIIIIVLRKYLKLELSAKIESRNAASFTIKSPNPSSNQQVFWAVHGKRLGYEQYRLEAWNNG